MGLDWIRVSRSYLLPIEAKQLLIMTPCKTFLPGATVLYDGGQFEIAIRSGDLLLCCYGLRWLTKRQVEYIYFKE
jgi:hypothetical protein